MRVDQLSRSQAWTILGCVSLMLSLSMGMRQSFGLFIGPMTRDIGVSTADFSFAIALQNMIWGLSQPFVGMLAERRGARLVTVMGVLLFALGLLICMLAHSASTLIIGMGLVLGVAMSCTGASMSMSIAARTAGPRQRSNVMGLVSAFGSFGLMIASPMAQALLTSHGWKSALASFVGLVLLMLPAAWIAGRSDRIELPRDETDSSGSLRAVLRQAGRHSGFRVMALAYFVCGLQLVFITTHLPVYLDLCGIDPSVGATALVLIGLFNALGSWVFGWLGGRFSKRRLLGGIYVARSLIMIAYFAVPPTPVSTMVFAAAMGSLWLGVVPLMNGLVIHLFGLRYVAMLSGIAFFSHQMGSFIGAWGGGLIYGALGSYEWAWKGAVSIGIIAGIAQMMMNVRPPGPMGREPGRLATA